jgi:lysophospholipase L1-like esterase
MRFVVDHFAGGAAWWWGLGLALALLVVECRKTVSSSTRRWMTIIIGLAFLWAGVAAIPVPVGWYPAAGCCLIVERAAALWPRTSQRLRTITRGVAIFALMSLLLVEIPWAITPTVSRTASPTIGVIGDSVTAGLNEDDITWPRLLAAQTGWQIHDASRQGATLRSARDQLVRLPDDVDLLLMEIGGNDLLEGLNVDTFGRQFDELLAAAAKPGRTIVLWELPLPPLHAEYGRRQRAAARRHAVLLLPRRHFAAVLATKGATVDGIHLSAAGQKQMAALVASLLNVSQNAAPSDAAPDSANYHRLVPRIGAPDESGSQ